MSKNILNLLILESQRSLTLLCETSCVVLFLKLVSFALAALFRPIDTRLAPFYSGVPSSSGTGSSSSPCSIGSVSTSSIVPGTQVLVIMVFEIVWVLYVFEDAACFVVILDVDWLVTMSRFDLSVALEFEVFNRSNILARRCSRASDI